MSDNEPTITLAVHNLDTIADMFRGIRISSEEFKSVQDAISDLECSLRTSTLTHSHWSENLEVGTSAMTATEKREQSDVDWYNSMRDAIDDLNSARSHSQAKNDFKKHLYEFEDPTFSWKSAFVEDNNLNETEFKAQYLSNFDLVSVSVVENPEEHARFSTEMLNEDVIAALAEQIRQAVDADLIEMIIDDAKLEQKTENKEDAYTRAMGILHILEA